MNKSKLLFFFFFILFVSGIFRYDRLRPDSNSNFGAEAVGRPKEIETPEPKTQMNFSREEMERLIEVRNLGGLMQLMKEFQKKERPQSLYLLADVCNAFNSYDFRDGRQYLYARDCSKSILSVTDDLPLDMQLQMVRNLQGVEEYRSGLVSKEKWSADRAMRIRFLFGLWTRVRQNIDPTFDVTDYRNFPSGNVPVPGPYMPGIRPQDIKEPDIRIKYVEAIAANKAKAQKFNFQVQLQRLDKILPEFVDQFIVGMYTQQPLDIADLDKALDLFGISRQRRADIRKAIKATSLP